jgi:hypothetical protein
VLGELSARSVSIQSELILNNGWIHLHCRNCIVITRPSLVHSFIRDSGVTSYGCCVLIWDQGRCLFLSAHGLTVVGDGSLLEARVDVFTATMDQGCLVDARFSALLLTSIRPGRHLRNPSLDSGSVRSTRR